MTERMQVGGLKIAAVLYDFIMSEALPGTGVEASTFWHGFDAIVHDLPPRNRDLLAKRVELQCKIDSWHRARAAQPFHAAAYKSFLSEIGYLVPETPDCAIET